MSEATHQAATEHVTSGDVVVAVIATLLILAAFGSFIYVLMKPGYEEDKRRGRITK